MRGTAPSLMAFDPNTATADTLIDEFPDIGLLSAEDVIDWRARTGAFPDEGVLVSDLGLTPDLAGRISRAAKEGAAPAAAAAPAKGAVIFFDDEPHLRRPLPRKTSTSSATSPQHRSPHLRRPP
ncbi:MAG: hypothetical protein HOO96_20820, partial [Polyangiaceae bacterium]|nr:hypothetical protein [Polyangiaceae bacterium]